MSKFSFRKFFKELFRHKNFFKISIYAFALVFAFSVFADSCSKADDNVDYSYKTDSFMTDVKVNEDYTYNVKETINVDFTSPKHGIFRYIPVSFGRYEIKNISVDGYVYDVNTDHKSNYKIVKIRIGDKDQYLTGKKKYVINYKIVGIKEKKNSPDFLYLDLIPTTWNSPIKYAKVNITVPKEIDWSKASIFYGGYGNKETIKDDSKFDIIPGYKKLTIEGKNLNANEGLTIKEDLGKGYWVGAKNYDAKKLFVSTIFVIVAILSILLWFRFGKKRDYVETVEFYPPENLTPTEIGYILDGHVDDKDILSMIVYFANKGYLKIEEKGKKSFKLIKVKEIDDREKRFAKVFFNSIFSSGDEVSTDNMPQDFGDKSIVVVDMLTGFYSGENSLFSKKSTISKWILMIVMVPMPLLFFRLAAMISNKDILTIIGGVISLVACVWLFVASILAKGRNSLSKSEKTVYGIIGLITLTVSIGSMIYTGIVLLEDIPIALVIGISYLITELLAVNMESRTKKSARLLGRILGFRNFIKTVELEKLKALVDEDPSYFYNILPYAYVFGLSERWINKFKNISVEPADWYSGESYAMFNTIVYLNMMNVMNNSLENIIDNQIAGNSDFGSPGDFSGGGGFSGGGFGGGGGGAW